eukprot:6853180-Pyramimonas_sp.AAC.1
MEGLAPQAALQFWLGRIFLSRRPLAALVMSLSLAGLWLRTSCLFCLAVLSSCRLISRTAKDMDRATP